MSLANYTTGVQAVRSVTEIMGILAGHGARAIATEYDEAGEITALSFQMNTPRGLQAFRLPVNVGGMKAALEAQGVQRSYRTEAHARKVAWRTMRDWVRAQVAIIEAEMVSLDQVFLPYMLVGGKRTLYEAYITGLLLSEGE